MSRLILVLAFWFAAGPSPAMAEVVMDDMRFSEEEMSQRGVLKRVRLWKNGVLPLKFARHVSQKDRQAILAACKEWEERTQKKIRCFTRMYRGRLIRVTQNEPGCFSYVGMRFRGHLNLGKGCMSRGVILHEFGHAIGLIHEHQRTDRNRYVRIYFDNIRDGRRHNFKIQPEYQYRTPYDFLSIMHYRRNSFAISQKKDTMTPLPEYQQYIDQMGRVQKLSDLDVDTVVEAYGS